jgi:spermidine/putrescine transport system ATP-binding protein
MSESVNSENGNETKTCLEIRNVTKRFPGVIAVDDVSLKIREGEIFSFLGPSGCGKTTLLRLVAGLENIDLGDILIDGNIVNLLPPYERDCSTVFQQHALFPHMRVFDNIAFGLVERKIPKNEIKKKVFEKIELVSLDGMEDRFPHQLSGGQKQRVALARSLVLEPAILLLDEPLAALDRKLRKEMQFELRRIQREVGTTFLNVTHDQKEALSLSDRIAVMNAGRMIQVGTPSDIYENPKTKFVASFMGATNIFSAKALSQKEDMVQLQTENGITVSVPMPKESDMEMITGFTIHSEMIDISTDINNKLHDSPQKVTALRGIVKEVFYQGDYSELTILIKDTDMNISTFVIRKDVEKDITENQEVIVSWKNESCNALSD